MAFDDIGVYYMVLRDAELISDIFKLIGGQDHMANSKVKVILDIKSYKMPDFAISQGVVGGF